MSRKKIWANVMNECGRTTLGDHLIDHPGMYDFRKESDFVQFYPIQEIFRYIIPDCQIITSTKLLDAQEVDQTKISNHFQVDHVFSIKRRIDIGFLVGKGANPIAGDCHLIRIFLNNPEKLSELKDDWGNYIFEYSRCFHNIEKYTWEYSFNLANHAKILIPTWKIAKVPAYPLRHYV